MDKLVIPVVAHKLNDLEPLCKMQALTCRCDIYALVKVIRLLAVDRSCNITGRIQRRAVLFENKTRRHAVLFEIDNSSSVVDLKQILLAELFNLRRHLIGVKALALIGIKFYVKLFICLGIFLKTDIYEPAPEREIFFVAVFELCKLFSCAVFESGVVFRFFMETHIERDKLVDTAVFNRLAASPHAVRGYELPELRSPVAEIVYSDALVSGKLMELFYRMSDDRCSEMSYMERLCDVR